MGANTVLTAPNGVFVLAYVVPGSATPLNPVSSVEFGILKGDGSFQVLFGGPAVTDDTPLNVVMTDDGPVLQYELLFIEGAIGQILISEAVSGDPDFPRFTFLGLLDEFTPIVVDLGLNLKGDDNPNVLNGAGFEDVIVGKGGDDVINGFGGDDVVKGGHGSDLLFCGGNNDSLFGGVGEDELYGDTGHDLLDGGSGADVMYGGFSGDVLFGGRSNDVLFGGNGIYELRGGTGNDELYGGNGTDVLRGNKGHDMLDGGKSNDRLYGDIGNDVLFGGDGNDKIYGGAGHDIIVGGEDADRLQGGAGRDVFVFASGDGSDRIVDFKADHDRIDLSAMGLTFEDIGLKQKDHDAILTAGNVQIRLEGFDVTDLEASDFLF